MAFCCRLGISFYTFQAISYVIDVRQKRIPAELNLVDYALYISFFPQLVAGPIERAGNILPQIKNRFIPLSQKYNAGVYPYCFRVC